MNYYNVPADFKSETLLQYKELNDHFKNARVNETYGQITIDNPVGSGRANDLLPKVDEKILADYVEFCKKTDIGFNYTLNTTCMGNKEFTEDGMEEIYYFLKKIYELGVRSLTVALPSLIEFIQRTDLKFDIKASTVCQINTPNKAVIYEKLGAKKLVLDESINRSFGVLKAIQKAVNVDVELITNVVCHQDCIYEMFHHNQKSHDYKANGKNKSINYYSHRCVMKRFETPENILKLGWIRPEDIKYYSQIGIHNFKLQGRQAVINGDPVRTVKAYMEEKYEGDFMELLDMFAATNSFKINVENHKLNDYIKPFINKDDFCKKDCNNCKYCENYMNKHFNTDEIKQVFKKANQFYLEYDEYIGMTKKLLKRESNTKLNNVTQFNL